MTFLVKSVIYYEEEIDYVAKKKKIRSERLAIT